MEKPQKDKVIAISQSEHRDWRDTGEHIGQISYSRGYCGINQPIGNIPWVFFKINQISSVFAKRSPAAIWAKPWDIFSDFISYELFIGCDNQREDQRQKSFCDVAFWFQGVCGPKHTHSAIWIGWNSALNKWHDGENKDYHEKERAIEGPVELVEEQEVGLSALYQPALWEPDKDHTEEKTEEQGP